MSGQQTGADDTRPDGENLHRLLFPVGERQRAQLRDLVGATDEPPEESFLAWHRGIAQALAQLVRVAGGHGGLADWLLLADAGAASQLLWGGDPSHPVSFAGRVAYLREAGAAPTGAQLGDSYTRVVPGALRHRLGEHYTPQWLVERMVAAGPAGALAADPACGDGRFLVALLARGHHPEQLWGADLNPLAVVLARIRIWLALGRPSQPPPVRVCWADFVLGESGPTGAGAPLPHASWYVGNPPWVTWRNLSQAYREALARRMAGSALHHAQGWAARVAAGQTDLAHVFVHEAVERVAEAGRVSFVLPRSTFKAPIGPHRLRQGTATSGRPYRFQEVWDCRATGPFDGVRGDAVVGVVDVDRPAAYPVRWLALASDRPAEVGWAVPSDPDDPGSPWLVAQRPPGLAGAHRWTDLRARGGVNTGGGNSAFYVEVLGTRAGIATVRNLPSRRRPVGVVTAEVESEFVWPLLRGRDVSAWRARPSTHLVLPHDPTDLRRPVPELQLARAAPLTYAYLCQFRQLLSTRRELHRWGSGDWYTLFRIGHYTAGCWRVVWPHSSGAALRAAVLGPGDRTVPDQKVVFVSFDAAEPALFLCALLNCAVVRRAAAGSAGLDASPNLIRRLVLPRFDPNDREHERVVSLAWAALTGEPAAAQPVAAAAARLFTTA